MNSTRYEFLGYRLEARQRQLRDPRGRPVELPARAFDTLLYLIEHHGQDIGKDRLMAAVWPDSVVEENNLSQAISALRRALGDQRTAPRFVMTLPGRGYRFIAEVSTCSDETTPWDQSGNARRNRVRVVVVALVALASAALALVLAPGKSVPPPVANSLAVLPFTPLLPDEADPALELGMADALIAHVSVLPGIVVRPVSAVRRFMAVDQDPMGAGRELGVEIVLAGSIHKESDHVRATARLLRVVDGHSLWAGRFEAPMSGIFDMQDEIGNAVLASLAARLGTRPPDGPVPRATSSPEAYQWYLTGVYNRQRHDLKSAAANFSAAVREDPQYAVAWSALSSMLAAQAVFNLQPPDTVFPQAREAAQRAIELDDSLADAKGALGHVLVMYERKYAEGEALYREARELDPSAGLVRLWTSINFLHLGRGQEALEEARRAQALEPGTLPFAANVAMMLYYNRDYDAAIVELERVLSLHPGFDHARSLLGRALLQRGDPGAALAHFAARVLPTPGSFGDLGRAYAAMGRSADALEEIELLEAKGREGFGTAYDIASVHALLGEMPKACAALSEALHDRSMGIGLLRVDPDFDKLRDHACFSEVTARLYPQSG